MEKGEYEECRKDLLLVALKHHAGYYSRKKMGLESIEGMSTAEQPVVQIKERLLRVWLERELDRAQCMPLK